MYDLTWIAKNGRIGGITFEDFGQAEKYSRLYFGMQDVCRVTIIDTEEGKTLLDKEKGQ